MGRVSIFWPRSCGCWTHLLPSGSTLEEWPVRLWFAVEELLGSGFSFKDRYRLWELHNADYRKSVTCVREHPVTMSHRCSITFQPVRHSWSSFYFTFDPKYLQLYIWRHESQNKIIHIMPVPEVVRIWLPTHWDRDFESLTWILACVGDFYVVLYCPDRLWGPPSTASISMGIGGKAAGVWNSRPSRAEVRNAWNYTATSHTSLWSGA
jgi:hypothetical protein